MHSRLQSSVSYLNASDGHIPLMRKDSSLSNDVFESVDNDDGISHPETVPEETSSQLETPTDEKSSFASDITEKSVGFLSLVH